MTIPPRAVMTTSRLDCVPPAPVGPISPTLPLTTLASVSLRHPCTASTALQKRHGAKRLIDWGRTLPMTTTRKLAPRPVALTGCLAINRTLALAPTGPDCTRDLIASRAIYPNGCRGVETRKHNTLDGELVWIGRADGTRVIPVASAPHEIDLKHLRAELHPRRPLGRHRTAIRRGRRTLTRDDGIRESVFTSDAIAAAANAAMCMGWMSDEKEFSTGPVRLRRRGRALWTCAGRSKPNGLRRCRTHTDTERGACGRLSHPSANHLHRRPSHMGLRRGIHTAPITTSSH